MARLAALVLLSLVLGLPIPVTAQEPLPTSVQPISEPTSSNLTVGGDDSIIEPEPVIAWEERTEWEGRPEALNFGLLGDNIDNHTGGLSFQVTDVALPGNFDLPVALTRRIQQGDFFVEDAEFGDWTYDVPRMHLLATASNSWLGTRCTNPDNSLPYITRDYGQLNIQPVFPVEYSNGLHMDIPGQGSKTILTDEPNAAYPAGGDYYTDDQWRIECGVNASDGGEGFYAYAPNGDRYRFDRFIEREAQLIWFPVYFSGSSPVGAPEMDPGNPDYVLRVRAMLMATEVRDVHGNTVTYTYDGNDRLTRIEGSDGRQITISYIGPSQLVDEVEANGRVWQYEYGQITGDFHDQYGPYLSRNSTLTRVVLPDGEDWIYAFSDMSGEGGSGRPCGLETGQVSVTSPTGVIGTFNLAKMSHRMGLSNPAVRAAYCAPFPGPQNSVATSPDLLDWGPVTVASVTEKTLSGPGMPTSTWSFTYEQDVIAPRCGGYPCTNDSINDPTNWTKVLNPDGTEVTYFHNWNSRLDGTGGRIARMEVRDAPGGTILETRTYTYTPTYAPNGVAKSRGGYLPLLFGPVDLTRGEGNVNHVVAERLVEITRDGETYTTRTSYNADAAAASYSYGQPSLVERYSTVSGGVSNARTLEVEYQHLQASWILGLPTLERRNGLTIHEAGYDADGQRLWVDAFGTRVSDFSYNANGTLAWYEDALGRRTSFSNYKRGYPQTITRPDLTQISATFDDNGWQTSQTNAVGTTISLSHDAMGRLTLVNYPAGFTDQTLSYANLGSGMVQTVTRGSKRTIVEYDGLLRPTRIEERAIADTGGSIFTRTEYDNMGRAVFTSFPSANSNPTTGTTTTYDALGRVIRTEENVSPFAATVTAYLTDNRTRVTDPSGNVTTTWASGYGGPGDGETIRIDHPLGLTTEMTYDAWGNLLTARQHGSHSGFSVDETQTWTYDSRLRLCRHTTPETNGSFYTYDDANQLITEARGVWVGTACGAAPAATQIVYGYDVMGRQTSINYPDASPDVTMGYDANGNLTSATRGISAWTYQYDILNRLIEEELVVDGRSYETLYAYTADGRHDTTRTPGNRLVEARPDGHGRPRAAIVGSATYAFSGAYHPSGQLESLGFGGGLTYTASFNARQQMTDLIVARTGLSALDFSYNYDANGRVTSVTDHATPGENRTFTYDGLGRLSSATGPWGNASYTYDLLNNIREKQLGVHTVQIEYDATNRISRTRDTRDGNIWRNYSWGTRGQLGTNSRLSFSYDRSDQPVAMGGIASGSFAYDAHNRRVKQTINGETIYSVYGLDGTLRYRDNITTGEVTDYIRLGRSGRTIARLATSGGSTSTTFVHNDHLGSSASATNVVGNLLWRESYTPFGETLNNPAANANNQGYTGHIQDTASGLTYMQARYYDPVIGRFHSSDPVGFASGGPGYFNRYAYTHNDPVNLVDPSGMCSTGTRLRSGASQGCYSVNVAPNFDSAEEGADEAAGGESPYRLTYPSDWQAPCYWAGNGLSCFGGHNVEAFYLEAQLGPPGVAELVGGRMSDLAQYTVRGFRLTARERASESLQASDALGVLGGVASTEGIITVRLSTGTAPSGWTFSGSPFTQSFSTDLMMSNRHDWKGVWIVPNSGVTRVDLSVLGATGANVRVTAFPAHTGAIPRGCSGVGLCE